MSNMKKQQTAVEWLVEQLNTSGFAQVVTDEEIQQAIKMEKEQILQALNDGKAMIISPTSNKSLEQYYNENFKK